MKRKMKQTLSIAVVAAVSVFVAACAPSAPATPAAPAGGGAAPAAPADTAGAPDEVIEMVLSGITTDAGKEGTDHFIELVYEKSGGTLILNHFPDDQLGHNRVTFESTIFGDIDIAIGATGNVAVLYADLFAFDAPFLFLNEEQAHAIMDGPVGQAMLEGMGSVGLKGLAWFENGFRNLTNSRVAARTPADVQGMSVRVMENEIHIAAWNAFGANPTPMAFAEVFTALQQGTVDAQENPLGIIYGNAFQEVNQYVSITQHAYSPFLMVMNLDRWNSLSDMQRDALTSAAREAEVWQRNRVQELDAEILTAFAEQGVTVVELTLEEKLAFQELVLEAGVFDLARSRMDNPDLLDQMLEQLAGMN
ncbi:MAG: DctP family TRAP transporter solute-binding subunit [Defluviitaleaceae bacterium]|nr:DctP family TRAP transporter solute-binding subunit [Defluviitaleaceae bacterium]